MKHPLVELLCKEGIIACDDATAHAVSEIVMARFETLSADQVNAVMSNLLCMWCEILMKRHAYNREIVAASLGEFVKATLFNPKCDEKETVQ